MLRKNYFACIGVFSGESFAFGGKPPNSTRVEPLRAPKVLRGALTGTSLLVEEFVGITVLYFYHKNI